MKRIYASICMMILACSLSIAQNQSATKQLTIKVLPAPIAISTASLPDATVGVAYSSTLAVTGGVAPFTWSVATGTLPPGLSLTPSTGVISGTPTTASSSTAVTFKVTDASGTIATIKLQWNASSTPLAQVSGYNLYRGTTKGGPYTKISTTTNSVLTASETAPRGQNLTRFYVVRTFNAFGESVNSNEAQAVVQ